MFFDDLRHAARALARRPTFAIVAVVSLAIGIGANTALYSFLHAIVLAPLPYPGSERMLVLQESVDGRDVSGGPQRFWDWAAQGELFEASTAWYGESMTLTGRGEPERVAAVRSLGDLPASFGLGLVRGRFFTPREADGSEPAALLTRGFFERRLGGDAGVIGQTLRLDGRSVSVVGVLDGDVDSGRVDVVVPAEVAGLPRSARFLSQLARLRAGVTPAFASERLAALAAELQKQYPDTDRGLGVRLIAYQDVVARDARGPLVALLGCAVFVLLSACLNIASLLLQRAVERRGELALRLTLGAGRWRLSRLLLAEGLLLGLLGGVWGLLLALWGIDLLRALAPADLPRLAEVRLSPPVALFAGVLALATALVCSFAPVWRGARGAPHAALQASGPRGGGRRHRLGAALVVAQVAISLALLFGAGLLLRSFEHLLRRPLGFDGTQLVAFQLQQSWDTPDEVSWRFQREVLETLRAVPGITAAEYADRLPLEGEGSSGEPRIAGRDPAAIPAGTVLHQRLASAGYLPLLGVPLVEGRFFEPADGLSAVPRTLVNQAAVRQLFAGRSPVGERIGIELGGREPRFFEIVGVVGDLPTDPAEPAPVPTMHVLSEQGFWPIGSFVARSPLPPAEVVAAVRAALLQRFPDQVVENVRTVPEVVDDAIAQPRLTALTAGLFALSALLLSAAGLYGLLANAVVERRFEIGVRMALGACPRDVERLFVRTARPLLAAGLMLGGAGCWGVLRGVEGLLHGVSPLDPVSVALALAVLGATAAVAVLVPARRAARANASEVLRAAA